MDIELSSQKYLNHIIMCLSWLMYKVNWVADKITRI